MKNKDWGRGRGGLIERGGLLERGAYLRGGLNRGFTVPLERGLAVQK